MGLCAVSGSTLLRGVWSRDSQQPLAASSAPTGAAPDEHPIQPAIHMVRDSLERMQEIKDYTCTFMKRERIDGELTAPERMRLKVRHEPFSFYLYCLGPDKEVGEEVIYVTGRNDGQVLAHTTGLRHRIVGTLKLEPTNSLLTDGSGNPITHIGIKYLMEDTLRNHESDLRYGECEVSVTDVELEGQPTKLVEIVHPERRKEFSFFRKQIWYDRDSGVPVRFARYEWPEQPGGEPPLVEEYVYENLKLNVGLTDMDFDTANPEYGYN